MATIAEIERVTNVTVFDWITRDADVPVVTDRPVCQGDVSVCPVSALPGPQPTPATTPLPHDGYPVVRGEAGGNTHSLHGAAFFDPSDGHDGDLVLGTLTVPDGTTAVLAHPEHGFYEIAPGTYRIGRQREWAGEWRLVAD